MKGIKGGIRSMPVKKIVLFTCANTIKTIKYEGEENNSA